MTDFCIDLVSPHSNGASLIYTVVGLLVNSLCDSAFCVHNRGSKGALHSEKAADTCRSTVCQIFSSSFFWAGVSCHPCGNCTIKNLTL